MKNICLLIIITLFISSCSNNLSRSDAKSQIISELKYPQDDLMRLLIEDRTIHTNSTINQWQKFKNRQLLTYQRFGQKSNGYFGKVTIGGNGVRAELTPKGNRYVVSEPKTSGYEKFVMVKKAKLEFVEITRIQIFEEMNIAEVNYKIKRTNISPFGKAMGIKEETIDKKATFNKFDDGWRIKK